MKLAPIGRSPDRNKVRMSASRCCRFRFDPSCCRLFVRSLDDPGRELTSSFPFSTYTAAYAARERKKRPKGDDDAGSLLVFLALIGKTKVPPPHPTLDSSPPPPPFFLFLSFHQRYRLDGTQ